MSVPFVLDRPDIVHRVACDVVGAVFPTIGREALLDDKRGLATNAWMRQVAMYLLVVRFGISQNEAARRFERDRSTVLHAARLVSQSVLSNETTARFIDFLEMQVTSRLNDLAASGADDEVYA